MVHGTLTGDAVAHRMGWLVRHGESTWNAAGIVAHGGTLRMLTACLDGVPVGQMGWEPLGNACILRSCRDPRMMY